MTKKTNRTRKKDRQIRLSPAQMVQPGAELASGAEAAGGIPGVTDLDSLREEYRYVAGDLARALALGTLVLIAAVVAVLTLT